MSCFREQVMKIWALILALFGCAPVQEAPKTPQEAHKILYGYYGNYKDQLPATLDHVNLAFVVHWPEAGDPTEQLVAIKAAGLKAVWMPPGAFTEPQLFMQLSSWKTLGLLDTLVSIYSDEPDLGLHVDPIAVRRVLAAFVELANVKLSVSFSIARGTQGIEAYDWVGVSAYAQGEEALSNEVQVLRSRLSPNQRLIIFVYGADPWRLNPEPFFNYALSDDKVTALIPFIWFSHDGTDFGNGIGFNGMLSYYRNVGLKIK